MTALHLPLNTRVTYRAHEFDNGTEAFVRGVSYGQPPRYDIETASGERVNNVTAEYLEASS